MTMIYEPVRVFPSCSNAVEDNEGDRARADERDREGEGEGGEIASCITAARRNRNAQDMYSPP